MLYVAVIEYENADRVPAARPAHRAYLAGLLAAGKVAAAGPFTDSSGAMIIYNADDPAEVAALIEADPYRAAGVFARWAVRPWASVFSAPGLLPSVAPASATSPPGPLSEAEKR